MWNSEELSAQYRHQAEDAERYLAEARGKWKRSRSYEHVFDEHMARFYVYNYLHGRTFLETREALLNELDGMNRGEVRVDPEVFDRERFERYYRIYVEQVIKQISETTQAGVRS
jgi:hypothetical protein